MALPWSASAVAMAAAMVRALRCDRHIANRPKGGRGGLWLQFDARADLLADDVADAVGDTKILGIFRGCKFVDATSKEVTHSAHFPAAQTATGDIVAFVEDNPFNLYEVQCTGSLARSDIGACVDIAYTAGSTLSGQSKAEVVSTSAATANYRLVGVSKDPENNELGSANVNMIVLINEHAYKIEAGV